MMTELSTRIEMSEFELRLEQLDEDDGFGVTSGTGAGIGCKINQDFPPVERNRGTLRYPTDSVEVGLFVDLILKKMWEYPSILVTKGCLAVPSGLYPGGCLVVKELMRLIRNRKCDIEELLENGVKEYKIYLIIRNLPIDFVYPASCSCFRMQESGTAIVRKAKFLVEMTVYNDYVALDRFKVVAMKGISITPDGGSSYLRRLILAYKIGRELKESRRVEVRAALEFNILKWMNKVIRDLEAFF